MISSVVYARFRNAYQSVDAPPSWISEWVTDDHLKSFILYYDEKDKKSNAIKLVYARDPVNIALNTSGSHHSFHSAFQTEPKGKSYMKQAKKLNNLSLPPNIAIYCKTPMININTPGIDVNTSTVTDASLLRTIHVMNLVGYGFDTPHQPDAQFFCENISNEAVISESKKQSYKEHVRLIIRKLLQCAEQFQFKRIMVAEVGCGAFAGNQNQAYATHVFYETLLEELYTTPTSFELGLLGHPAVNTDKLLKQLVRKTKHTFYKGVHLIPDIVFEMTEPELQTTLFVNAWDPHSAVGNGNWNDRSLDGFFGRSTAMAAICHPYTNDYLTKTNFKNHMVSVSSPSHPSNTSPPISIVTSHGIQSTNEQYALWISQFKSIEIEGYSSIEIPQQLLIYAAMKSNNNVKAVYLTLIQL